MARPTEDQLQALVHLWEVAQADHSASRVCVKLLLGLYNGPRFPFDLTELRCLDDHLLPLALAVIEMDARPQAEVHELLQRRLQRPMMGARFELLACRWRLKGRCKAAAAEELRQQLAAAAVRSQAASGALSV